jgi:cytochrome c oxidase subunit 4|tara:strand:+ start:367 stop:816 length:450 start_codon:yes stop_codon:yes gene_type:complete
MTEHTEHDPDHADDHDDHPHVGKQVFITVFLALTVLTGASFVIGNYGLSMGFSKQVTWVAMMAVSCAKAGLVICCFMHLWWEANWKWVLTVPTSIMAVFLVIMLIPDVGCRTGKYSSERWNRAATDSDQVQQAAPAHGPSKSNSDTSHE